MNNPQRNTVLLGDCKTIMREMPENCVDAIVTDPPYGLEFMGEAWDKIGDIGKSSAGFSKGAPAVKGVRGEIKALPQYNAKGNVRCRNCGKWKWGHKEGDAGGGGLGCQCENPDFPNVRIIQGESMQAWHLKWAIEALRVAKPGAHMLAFGGARTHHRLMCAIEDAGWEIRDTMMWVYGSGFPKSLDVSKAIDKVAARLLSGQSVVQLKQRLIELFDACGKTRKEIDEECGFRACNYLTLPNEEKRPDPWINVLPSQEKWQRIKEVIGCGGGIGTELDMIYAEAEREVIGQITKARSTSCKSALPTVGGETIYETWDITAPTTDAAKQWSGWGTALKPAWEPVILARKPLEGTVAENVQKWGTGALNIDGCRVRMSAEDAEISKGNWKPQGYALKTSIYNYGSATITSEQNTEGRWPANLIHDGSDEVVALFPEQKSGGTPVSRGSDKFRNVFGEYKGGKAEAGIGSSEGSAARFFFTAKASSAERNKYLTKRNPHPTVKPIALMRYLCRLITPPGGLILDPFCGSGSTGVAAFEEGFDFILIDNDSESCETAKMRCAQKRLGERSDQT